jgi:hypothetical protein
MALAFSDMIIRSSLILILAFFSINSPLMTHDHELCSGFLPENDLQIPVSIFQVGGITEQQFNDVLDKVENFYAPVIQARGATLKINRDWRNNTVNASASQMGPIWNIRMYGGLARHPAITPDGFMLVACHEIGHHIGGAPKVSGWWGSNWASNEGTSDYFATLRCLRDLFDARETEEFVRNYPEIDPHLREKCEEIYHTQDEENFCIRMGLAGLSTASLFKDLKKLEEAPRFDTPDSRIVNSTSDAHPEPQCRLDTYFQGALCVHDRTVALSDTDPSQGTCTERSSQTVGLRPRCWFSP